MTMHCGGIRCAKDSCRCTCACQFACMGPCAKCKRHQMLRQCLLSQGANICGQCCGHSICMFISGVNQAGQIQKLNEKYPVHLLELHLPAKFKEKYFHCVNYAKIIKFIENYYGQLY
ncbi:hypothetical protein Mgra_00008517 [Meloidogyne graminicola]|uniref:Uncharacterized protein n=1 Tax=Meloidogyne graminicola TaxID=189291 RepID=A0A8S9ZFI0_9BILA|nr:hypothetical protein Mgra_00008517 [Meloidogyne graminicola]